MLPPVYRPPAQRCDIFQAITPKYGPSHGNVVVIQSRLVLYINLINGKDGMVVVVRGQGKGIGSLMFGILIKPQPCL